MSKYLVQTTEVYRFDDEEQVANFIEESKSDKKYALTKYNCEHKERKSKGEIIDSWIKVTLTKTFCDEKEPDCIYDVNYEVK